MKVIQQNGDVHPTLEEAQDGLHGLSHIPGFVFGYVDEKDNRPVAFFKDAYPNDNILRGQRRRTLVFAHQPAAASEKPSSVLAEIGECIRNGTDNLAKR